MASKPYQSPLVCHGHSRPIVELAYSAVTEDGVFLISASKGAQRRRHAPRGCGWRAARALSARRGACDVPRARR
jgi:hypothetical protein